MKICYYSISIILLTILYSCNEYTPKPKGYFRIDISKSKSIKFAQPALPYAFSIPNECVISYDSTLKSNSTLTIEYPRYHAQILCTYKSLKNKNFRTIAEQSRNFVYRHSIKATAINEKIFEHQDQNVYGVFYDLKGNVATPCQFVLTDSTHHYFRGALYFNCLPKADSLAPVIKFIKADILNLMQTFEWK